jgi:hypothetical protein
MYEWCKYAALNFSTADLENMQIATKTKWAQDVLDKNLGTLQTLLKPALQVEVTFALLTSSGVSCSDLLRNSLLNPSATVIQNFCGLGWTKPTIEKLISFCNKPTTSNFQKNKANLFGFNYMQLRLLCDRDDDTENSIGDILNRTEVTLAQQYGCFKGHCSAFEIAMKQMANSSITRNPPAGTSLTKATSVKSWMPDIFPFAFELSHFLELRSLTNKLAPIDYEAAKEVFDWNNMRSPLALTKALAEKIRGSDKFIQTRMHFSDSAVFEQYINYIALDGYLGGLTFTGTVCDIIFGLSPDIVTKMRTIPPLKGGDPSTPEFVSMNQNNTWLQQTRYTGKSDLKLVGNFYSTNCNRSVNMLKQFWDGNSVTNQTYNPWAEEVSYIGGDNNFSPHLDSSLKQWGYISDLYKSFGSLYQNKAAKNLGLETMSFKADDSEGDVNEFNKRYYMDKYKNVLNYTSVKQAPIYLSKMGFYTANHSIANNVQLSDYNGYPFVWTDEYDGNLYIEPRTGVPVDLAVNFQINVDISKDDLLETREDFLIPVFLLRRSMTMNDRQVISSDLG